MRISTLAVAFLRHIWPMGPSDLPGGPNTNVSSPLANQVHSMTLCAIMMLSHTVAGIAPMRGRKTKMTETNWSTKLRLGRRCVPPTFAAEMGLADRAQGRKQTP